MSAVDLTLRQVDATFAASLKDLWVRTFTEAYADEHTAEDIAAYCAAHFTEAAARALLKDADARCTVAFRQQRAVGFTVIRHANAPHTLDGPAAELKQIYVLADEFGTGTGRHLFDTALADIKNAGGEWVWLTVSDRNHRAQAFYEKQGFSRIGPGETITVGDDTLRSSILARRI